MSSWNGLSVLVPSVCGYSVDALREEISQLLDIVSDRLILLTGDGEELEDDNLVAGYRVGTVRILAL